MELYDIIRQEAKNRTSIFFCPKYLVTVRKEKKNVGFLQKRRFFFSIQRTFAMHGRKREKRKREEKKEKKGRKKERKRKERKKKERKKERKTERKKERKKERKDSFSEIWQIKRDT